MTFETTADIIFEPDEGSLRSVRDAVESIGPVPVEYEPTRRNPAGGRVGRADGAGLEGRQTMSILSELRDLQEDTLIQLEDMADDLGSGGGPTEILTGVVGDVGSEAAGTAAETVGSVGGTAGGAALGTLVGEVIADTLGSGGDSDDGDDGGPEPVEIANDDTPVSVERPTLAVEEPTLDVADPSPLTIDDTNLPLPVEAVDPIPVDAPESIPVDMGDGDITARSTATAIAGGGGSGVPPSPPAGGGGYEGPGFVESVTETAEFGANVGSFSLGGLGPPGILAGALGGTVAGGIGGAIGYGANRVDHALTGDVGAGSGEYTGGSGRPPSIDADIRADRRSNISVDVSGLERLKDDVIDEVEQMHDQDIRELERELQKLEDALRGA